MAKKIAKKAPPKKTVRFTANKTKKIPTKVSFKTSSGKTVKFSAVKAKKVPTKVAFKAKKK